MTGEPPLWECSLAGGAFGAAAAILSVTYPLPTVWWAFDWWAIVAGAAAVAFYAVAIYPVVESARLNNEVETNI